MGFYISDKGTFRYVADPAAIVRPSFVRIVSPPHTNIMVKERRKPMGFQVKYKGAIQRVRDIVQTMNEIYVITTLHIGGYLAQ